MVATDVGWDWGSYEWCSMDLVLVGLVCKRLQSHTQVARLLETLGDSWALSSLVGFRLEGGVSFGGRIKESSADFLVRSGL